MTHNELADAPERALAWKQAVIQASSGALILLQVTHLVASRHWDAVVLQGTIARAWEEGTLLRPGVSLREKCPGLEKQWPQAFEQAIYSGKVVRLECSRIQPGRWTQVDVVPVDPSQNIVGLLAQDITLLRQRETEVTERKHHYRSVIDRMPLPIWGVNAHGVVQYVNSRFDTFFGMFCSSGKVAWATLIHPDDYEHFMLRLRMALENVSDFSALVRGRRADGQWRWLEVQANACFSVKGELIGLDGSFRDVTDHHALVQARDDLLESERAARITAETSTRIKDEFLATLSHEMRTPLTTILGWTELLLAKADPADMQYRGLSVISSSAETLSRLISDMLDLSGMLVGKLYLDLKPVALGEILREAVTALEGSERGTREPIRLNVPEEEIWVLGDSARLRQVFWNLLSNARKFTSQSRDGCITLDLQVHDGHCRVSVHDNGTGIAPEFLPHLFDRFSQADASTTRRHGGLGLGLAIVQQLVSLHGGKVAVSSEGLGRGSCFEIQLPLLQQRDGAQDAGSAGASAGALVVGTDSQVLEGYRLLLVDDQPDILEYLGQALRRHGAQIELAVSGNQALQLIASQPADHYQAVLSDISMPGMDGYSLARAVRQDLYLGAHYLPMIAITALARESDCRDALANGFQAVVTKPCNQADLVAEILRCCRLEHGQRLRTG